MQRPGVSDRELAGVIAETAMQWPHAPRFAHLSAAPVCMSGAWLCSSGRSSGTKLFGGSHEATLDRRADLMTGEQRLRRWAELLQQIENPSRWRLQAANTSRDTRHARSPGPGAHHCEPGRNLTSRWGGLRPSLAAVYLRQRRLRKPPAGMQSKAKGTRVDMQVIKSGLEITRPLLSVYLT